MNFGRSWVKSVTPEMLGMQAATRVSERDFQDTRATSALIIRAVPPKNKLTPARTTPATDTPT